MIKTVYERKEIIDSKKVRSMCIEHNFYTEGTNEDYNKMFEKCFFYSGKIEQLRDIAVDIIDHSDKEELDDYGFDTFYDVVCWVMGLIVKECILIYFDYKEV